MWSAPGEMDWGTDHARGKGGENGSKATSGNG